MWKVLVLLVLLASSSLALRADDPSPEIRMNRQQIWELKHSEDVTRELDRRREFFEAEMATGAVPDWAGDYYDGDGLGRNVHIRIAPQIGFVTTWSGCLGLYDLNYGSVDLRANRLTLNFELPNDTRNLGFPEELILVRWGERMYLLAEDELKPFVNAVNSGQEPQRHCIPSCGFFRLRRGDAEKPVSGVPDLPAEYRRFLSTRAITGKVVRILDSETTLLPDSSFSERKTRVEIDFGREAGLWEGMELYHQPSAYPGSGFEVVKIAGQRAVAIKRDFISSDEPGLEPGLCVSTRPRDQTCQLEQTAALR